MKPVIKALMATCVSVGVASCMSPAIDKAVRDLPCYDGWLGMTMDRPRSKIIEPTENMISMVTPQIESGRKIACWHQLPSGNLLVLSADQNGDKWATEFVKAGKELKREYDRDEIIVIAR